MSTARRFQWANALLCLTLLVGIASPAPAAEDDSSTEMSLLEHAFWICEEDHILRESSSALQCCDEGACITCSKDFSVCHIESNTRGSASPGTGLASVGLNIRPMQDRPSEAQLQGVCTSVKANCTNLEGFGYSCMKPNCNGKGDYCTIVCHDDRRCTAGTPDVIKGAVSLRGILQNGNNIDRRDSGSESPSDTDSGPDDGDNPCGPDGCLY